MKKLLILAAMTLGIAATGVVQAQTVYPQVIGPAGAHAKVGNTTVNATVGQVVNGTTLTGNQLVTQGFQQPYSTQPIDTNLTKYAIGKMTPQSVWQTTSLRFYVYSEALGPKASLSISVSKPTSGPVTFNPALGYFTFTPAASDTSVFSITFRAKLDSRLDSQVVVFQTQPYLQREQAVFGVGNGQSFPAPDGKEYLIVSDIPLSDDPNATPDFFNQMQRNTRTVSISGMEVVVANGHTNGLYNFNNNEDIRTLNIYGERVVIKDPFDLPQTNVTIYARELVFEDDGYINTTPRKTLGPQTGTTPAIPGVKAGTITLHINKYVSTPMVRLIQIGGDGQDGGQVKAGDAANGGDLYATLEVDAYSDRSGGLGGKFPQIDLLPAIYKGTPGQFIKIEKQNSWLHPNYMRVVRKYADDAYFLGFSEYTRQRAGMYLEEVNRYQASGEWAELSDTLQLELEQLRAEFAKTVTQIDDNLDYFGNPPGWVGAHAVLRS